MSDEALARIDQLLQGTDLLSKLGQIAEAELPSFSEKTSPAVDALVEALRVPAGGASATTVAASPPTRCRYGAVVVMWK